MATVTQRQSDHLVEYKLVFYNRTRIFFNKAENYTNEIVQNQ
jgi:hypothetical protein